MKKNNKGFMLVEVIVVAVVVATIMTSLYVVFNRVYNTYTRLNKYNDTDLIYALRNLEDDLIDNGKFNTLIKEEMQYKKIECDNNDDYCKKIFSTYNINSVYLVRFVNGLDKLKNDSNINETFKDYLDYLGNNLEYSYEYYKNGSMYYSHILIAETNDYKYSYLITGFYVDPT